MLSKLNKGGGALVMSKDGRNLYLLSGGQISKVDMNSGQLKGMSYNAEFEWKKPEERAYLFDHVWQQVVDKFYAFLPFTISIGLSIKKNMPASCLISTTITTLPKCWPNYWAN